MKLRILGCSGGIGDGLKTTSILLDDNILIDAGTGVGELSFDEMVGIDHVFLTHSHLDHICFIPFIVDTVGHRRSMPLTIHGLPQTLQVLKAHIFNGRVWPDFAAIPSSDNPFLKYQELTLGQTVQIKNNSITTLPANHVVPAVGYRLDSGQGSFVFTGDTTTNDKLWDEVNKIDNLKGLIIETAFCEVDKDLAKVSKHLCPSLLAAELKKLKHHPEIYITHLKSGEMEQTMEEVINRVNDRKPHMLIAGQEFEF